MTTILQPDPHANLRRSLRTTAERTLAAARALDSRPRSGRTRTVEQGSASEGSVHTSVGGGDVDGVGVTLVVDGESRTPGHHWPEHTRAALADGWMAIERTGQVSDLLAERTSMTDQQRRQILDEVLVAAAGLLRQDPEDAWTSLSAAEAFDRLQTAYEELVRGVFAYNSKWRPWRGRVLRSLSRLAYVPPALGGEVEEAVRTSGIGPSAYSRRFRVLVRALDQLIDQLQADDYGPDAVCEAFRRLHDEPGRAWNIAEWSSARTRPSEENSTSFR